MKTKFPFLPKLRVDGDTIVEELWEQIEKISAFYEIPAEKMSARIELLPNPETKGKTHYILAEVEYDGKIKKMIRKSKACRKCGHQKVMHRPKGEGHKLFCVAYTCKKADKRCEYEDERK